MSTPPPEGVLVEEDRQRVMTGFDRPQRMRTRVTERYRMSLLEDEDWDELYELAQAPDKQINRYEDPSHSKVRQRLSESMLRRMIALQDRAPLPSYRAQASLAYG